MNLIKIPLLAVVVFVAAYAADQGNDPAFRFHAAIIMVVAADYAMWELRRTGDPRPVTSLTDYRDDVVRADIIATAFWGIVGFLVGVFIALAAESWWSEREDRR